MISGLQKTRYIRYICAHTPYKAKLTKLIKKSSSTCLELAGTTTSLQNWNIMEDFIILKMKPDCRTTFHIHGLLSVPPRTRSVYTGMRFKEPPYAMFASASTIAQPPPASTQKDDARDVTQKDALCKTRTVYTEGQLSKLEKAFDENKYLTKSETEELAGNNELTYQQVRIWMQNRRQRWRPTMGSAEVAHEREKMRSRSRLRRAESLVGPIRLNRIITEAGLEFEELSEGQLNPVVILADRKEKKELN